MEPNGAANGVGIKPDLVRRSSKFDGSVKSKDGPGRNPLKRTRDEWDEDGYEFPGNYRESFAHNGTKQSRRDSADRERHSLSPTSMRHSFIPERNDDHWKHSTRHQHQRTNSGGSNPAHRQGRADQWSRSMPFSSPPPRSPVSPPTRPRLGSRTTSVVEYPTARHSFPTYGRRASESSDQPRYTSLKWTNPDLQPARATNASAPKPSVPDGIIESPLSAVEDRLNGVSHEEAPIQVNFYALKSAPTGPKLERNLIAANHVASRRPFIFISGQSLPPSPTTVEHLFKFLAKWVKKEADINFDGKGWYLYFDNTVSGLRRLDECYWAKTGHTLFSQYVLEMARHPDGLKNADLDRTGNQVDHSLSSVVVHVDRAANTLQRASTALNHVARSSPDSSHMKAPAATTDPRLALKVQARAPPFSLETRANGYIPPARHSTPLRVPPAHDRDDASSSISGVTGSDLSASKLSKCHVCKKVSDHDILVQCSTCPRRWHHRCHLNPSIPSGFESDHPWQCKRCVKKNVQPKSRLSHASFTEVGSPVPSVGQPDEPATKKRRFDEPESREPSVDLLKDNPSDPLEEIQPSINDVLNQETFKAETFNQYHDQIDDPDLGITAPANIDELEDLVEKSFSTPNGAANSQERWKKPSTLNITRKKVARTAVETVTNRDEFEGQHQLPDGATDASASKAKVPDELPKETSPKRKPHKWSGGGADRDIITAGLNHFGLDTNARKTREDAVKSASHVEDSKVDTQTLRLEVPESPEESRTPNKSNGNEDGASSAKSQASPKVKLKLNNTKSKEHLETEGSTSQIQTAPSQRMKASGSSAGGRCKQCNKPIAFNPAGKKLCVACKKSAAIEAATPPTEQRSKDDDVVVDDLQPATPTVAEKINLGILDLLKSTPSAQGEGSEASAVEDKISAPPPTKLDAACATCRARHKRCTHRSALVSSEEETQNNENGTVEDDLDFWDRERGRGIPSHATNGDGEERGVQTDGDQIAPDDDGDRSSSLSDAPDHAPSVAVKRKKRQSHTRPARDEFDIGDSWLRPNNSYTKLICMALLTAPNQRLSAKEIENWIDENVPSYNLKEGNNWQGGITATLSMGLEKQGKTGLWMKVGGDETKKNAKCSYQLLPGNEHKILHWDPVLKEPCWPLEHRSEDKGPKGKKERVEGSSQSSKDKTGEAFTSPTQTRTPKKRFKLSLTRTPKRPTKHAPKTIYDNENLPFRKQKGAAMEDPDIDELQLPDAESSDEEPLADSRRIHAASAKAKRDGEAVTQDVENIGGVHRLATARSHSTGPKTPAKLPLMPQKPAVDWNLVAHLIKEDAENVDYSAKSLYDEWPEWDPKNRFDPDAKIAEIQSRPTRKQRFGTKSKDTWAQWKPDGSTRQEKNSSPSKLSRITRSFEEPVFEWQRSEDVKYCDSFEEMFGVPELPIPIIQDDKIAFRDGTWNDYDGSLRRAKKIYPTGYAKF